MSTTEEVGYSLSNMYRGLAVIIVDRSRNGADKDLSKMKEFFKFLKFKTLLYYKNLTGRSVMETVRKVCQEEKNKESDCFVLVISSHGGYHREVNKQSNTEPDILRHALYFKDNDQWTWVYVDELINELQHDSLQGKPKILFIQACRSSSHYKYDDGVAVTVQETDTGRTDNTSKLKTTDATDDCVDGQKRCDDIYKDWQIDDDGDVDKSTQKTVLEPKSSDESDPGHREDTGETPPLVPFDVVQINCPKDFLIMYPVQPHNLAFRNPTDGSYLLHYMYENRALLRSQNLLQFLTKVSQDIAGRDYARDGLTELQMCATLVHKLTGDVHFNQRK